MYMWIIRPSPTVGGKQVWDVGWKKYSGGFLGILTTVYTVYITL